MTTKRSHVLVFGRKVDGCPRCDELKAGAPTIKWAGSQRKQREADTLKRIREHDFTACAKRNIVCTCFDW